jgi:addiction module RelE/StbE family toxin
LKIKLTKGAVQDLHSIENYISQDKPTAAKSVINESIENIASFPSLGRVGRVPHTKELVVSSTPLIIVYQIRHGTLFIVRIIHAARKWP